MKIRPLGNTGIDLPVLAFGVEFRSISIEEAMRSTSAAIKANQLK